MGSLAIFGSVSISLILDYADMQTDVAFGLSIGVLVSFYGDIIKPTLLRSGNKSLFDRTLSFD